MSKTVLCVIFGGASSEHEISLRSAAGVIRNVDRDKFELKTLAILRDGRQFLYNGEVDKIEDGSYVEDKPLSRTSRTCGIQQGRGNVQDRKRRRIFPRCSR